MSRAHCRAKCTEKLTDFPEQNSFAGYHFKNEYFAFRVRANHL